MRSRATRRVLVTMLASAATLTGCTAVVDGSGSVPLAAAAHSSSSASASTSAPASAPTVANRAAQIRTLTSRLERAPSGSQTWGDSWGNDINPTLAEYVTRFYKAKYVSSAENELRYIQMVGIAHRTWIAANHDQADILLMQFDGPNNAITRYNDATYTTGSPHPHSFSVPGGPFDSRGFYSTKRDAEGYTHGSVWAVKGPIVSETFVYCHGKFDRAEAISWAKAQIKRLPG